MPEPEDPLARFTDDDLKKALARRKADRDRAALCARREVNARVVPNALLLLTVFDPPHAGRCTDDGCENETSCARCALITAQRHGYVDDTVRFELSAGYRPIDDPDA